MNPPEYHPEIPHSATLLCIYLPSAFLRRSLQEILSSLNVPYFVAAPLLIQDLQSWKDQGAFSSLQSYFFVKGMYGTNVCPHFWGRNCWSLAVDWHIDFHMAGWSLECSSSLVNFNYSWLDGNSLKHQPLTPFIHPKVPELFIRFIDAIN